MIKRKFNMYFIMFCRGKIVVAADNLERGTYFTTKVLRVQRGQWEISESVAEIIIWAKRKVQFNFTPQRVILHARFLGNTTRRSHFSSNFQQSQRSMEKMNASLSQACNHVSRWEARKLIKGLGNWLYAGRLMELASYILEKKKRLVEGGSQPCIWRNAHNQRF